MSDCTHDFIERETAVTADGYCPLCMAAEIKRLRKGWKREADKDCKWALAEIAQLRRDLEIWKRNGGDILQRAEIERLIKENENLREQLATCRELREYDRKEIHRLRAEIELVSK